MNHAPRKAVTAHQTKRRRPSLAALGSGPTVARPPAAAAFDVPTAGVPTYFVASAPPVAGDFAASGLGPSALGLTVSDSGPAMHTLLDFYVLLEILFRRPLVRRLSPCAPANDARYSLFPCSNSKRKKGAARRMTFQECATRFDTAKIVSSERENEQGNHTRRANQLPAPVAHRIEKAFFEDIARPQTFSPAPQIRTGYYSNQKISSMRVSIRYFCRCFDRLELQKDLRRNDLDASKRMECQEVGITCDDMGSAAAHG